jgi:hypothetical protein
MLSPAMQRSPTRGYLIPNGAYFADSPCQQHGYDNVWNLTMGNPTVPPPPRCFEVL